MRLSREMLFNQTRNPKTTAGALPPETRRPSESTAVQFGPVGFNEL